MIRLAYFPCSVNHVVMDLVVVQGMGDFLNEMATMMNQSKPSVSRALHHQFITIDCAAQSDI